MHNWNSFLITYKRRRNKFLSVKRMKVANPQYFCQSPSRLRLNQRKRLINEKSDQRLAPMAVKYTQRFSSLFRSLRLSQLLFRFLGGSAVFNIYEWKLDSVYKTPSVRVVRLEIDFGLLNALSRHRAALTAKGNSKTVLFPFTGRRRDRPFRRRQPCIRVPSYSLARIHADNCARTRG